MTTKLTVLLGFIVAFSAGLLTGLNSRHAAPLAASPATTAPTRQGGPRDRDRSFLARELNLTPEQRELMNDIWAPMATRGPRDQDDLRRQYRNERDEAIANLIRTEDLRSYDAILKEYQIKLTALDEEFRKAYEAAVERTKVILTAEQRAKYEEILKRNQPWDRGPRERRGGPPNGFDDANRRSGDRATTRPAER